MSSDLYAPPQHVDLLPTAWGSSEAILAPLGGRSMQDPASELPRISILGTSVNRPFGFASHGNDDFSSSVSCFQIPHGLGDLAQWVSPVNDRGDLPRFGELLED
jgi:hypothetical protein